MKLFKQAGFRLHAVFKLTRNDGLLGVSGKVI